MPEILKLIEMTPSEGVKDAKQPAVFVDWITASQLHPKGGLPSFVDGVHATFDAYGTCRFERAMSKTVAGSHETGVRILCDGFRVGISGNVGRFNRQDNLYNFGIRETISRANGILRSLDLPPFSDGPRWIPASAYQSGDRGDHTVRGATVSRLDVTCNYSAGSDAQARAVIRWLAAQSIKRAKRGYSGDESVWWSNTRMMLKAYRKGAEMEKHHGEEQLIDYANDAGLVRVELELKRRELTERGLHYLFDVTDERLAEIFLEETEIFRRVDSSDEPDVLANVPSRSRAYAAAWLGGQDVRLLCSQATLYRHAKVLREYGIDILETRNIQSFPVKVRVIDLQPLEAPDWYRERLTA